MFGKDKAKKEMLGNLPAIFEDIGLKFKFGLSDFGSPEDYNAFFDRISMEELPDMEKAEQKKWFVNIKRLIDQDLPMLLKPIKSTSVVDPRDRKHAIMLQRDYQKQMADQLAGVRGNQGGLGDMATPIYRQQTMPNASTLPIWTQMELGMTQPQSPAQYQDPNAQMAMMQQMMMQQMMQQQQMQRQMQMQMPMQVPQQQQPMGMGMMAPQQPGMGVGMGGMPMTPEQQQMMMMQMMMMQQQMQAGK
jgi:hypothetical protein